MERAKIELQSFKICSLAYKQHNNLQQEATHIDDSTGHTSCRATQEPDEVERIVPLQGVVEQEAAVGDREFIGGTSNVPRVGSDKQGEENIEDTKGKGWSWLELGSVVAEMCCGGPAKLRRRSAT